MRIRLSAEGQVTELGACIERLLARPVQAMNGRLISTEDGQPLAAKMLRDRFDAARVAAAAKAESAGLTDLAKRVRAFQFRDIRPKAASEIVSLDDANKLLGHSDNQITQRVYRRVGEVVKPTR
ncbi:hypothetical protein [Pseudoduganella albidiflava]|uniref:Tyrosine-type recombinase/integrase n=1 Tax=Pseudoduganella albidiflava TaxID=321983 RepID=A0A411X1K6_9BURK|nr:hypothetical protein [Pseudoduganella albidiflava]QBI02860.1 hypothetical protein EYF70_19915 [Pseudoduganella albidiflava]GGY56923.1 hypothetical protein GCM10007387_44350 [Pseudoduganella albidiflava]